MRANLKDCFEFPYAKTFGAKNQSLPHYSRKIRAVLYPTTPSIHEKSFQTAKRIYDFGTRCKET
ncbi:hypothetical protein LEP1GSC169_0567 [Leptospira santarosai str. HAI1349]|nr:hypothetical protein LEP1GSC169_0567 [Leptospira santarosai str. HAI1349]